MYINFNNPLIENELPKIQKELDEKKYRHSEIAKIDMSGKMEYCIECSFKTLGKDCSLHQLGREKHFVCARQYIQLKKENKLWIVVFVTRSLKETNHMRSLQLEWIT